MSNGYIVAVEADIAAAREVADGFDLDLIGVAAIDDPATVAAALAGAANVGLVLSAAAEQDATFVALMRSLADQLASAQLILATPEARAAFAYLPQAWPTMSLEQAIQRARALWEQRHPGGQTLEEHVRDGPKQAEEPAPEEQTPAPQAETAPAPEAEPPPALQTEAAAPQDEPAEQAEAPAPETEPPAPLAAGPGAHAPAQEAQPSDTLADDAKGGEDADRAQSFEGGAVAGAAAPPADASTDARADEAPPAPPAHAEPPPPASAAPPAPKPDAAVLERAPAARARSAAPSAPADATAFAPKKLRRGTPELVRIAIHQPKDLAAVIKAARKVDPRAEPAPSGMSIGEVALGASVGVALEVRGAACDGTLQRRTWAGEPIDFSFSVEPDAEVKQAVFLARVFVDDAQIGVLAFTRPVSGPAKKAADFGDKVRLKRHKRVFLSYSSKDRETVAAIATAYSSAGVEHFWDRASLKSGEEWSPRLRREIERADLFHLCWSKAAAESEWVEKEAEYAVTRRRRSNGKRPDITVQMLDGPPWAKHPDSLDSINFDDFVRAAIVGYARGDGSS